jgi:Mrp family chromosome partitioning ATPase
MRQLRAAIEQAPVRSAASDGGRVALVTSSRVGEGKSTLALALARSCAMAGQRTVLIDANLRAPSLHSTLGLCPRTGLLQYLLGEGDAEDARQGLLDDPLSGVAIFPGRGPAVQPTDRAAQSQRLDLLIGACRKVWDRIILDSAALGPVVDTRFMAPHADILVQCVGFAATPREEVVLARDQLRQAAGAGVPLVAALNRVPAAASYGKG